MRKVKRNNDKVIEIINEDKNELPFIISIPHSGILLTKEMVIKLEDKVILANTDWYLDKLYSFLKDLGYTVIINKMNRYVIDPNRSLEEKSNPSFWHSAIYTRTTYDKKLYKKEISLEEKEERIKDCYQEYHDNLKRLLEEKLKYFSKVYLLDLHSFGSPLPYDVILGNNDLKTASKDFNDLLEKLFKKKFKVACNERFLGGYIIKHYGNSSNVEAMQIEISYKKYIANRDFKEEEFPKIDKTLFLKTQKDLQTIFENLKNIR